MPYLKPNYLQGKQRHVIQTMFENERYLVSYPMRQFRFGVKADAFNPDMFEFGHMRWGLCETPLGSTWYYKDRINAEIPKTVRIGGVTFTDPFLALSKQGSEVSPTASNLFHQSFRKALWSEGRQPTLGTILSLRESYEALNTGAIWIVKTGPHSSFEGSIRDTSILKQALGLWNGFAHYMLNDEPIPESAVESLMGNHFLSSLTPFVQMQEAVIRKQLFENAHPGGSGCEPVGLWSGWTVPLDDTDQFNDFRNFFNWFRKATADYIDWSARFASLYTSNHQVTLEGDGGSVVLDPGEQPELRRDEINDVKVPLLSLLEAKLHACKKVDAPIVHDRPSYEASRMTILDELRAILTNELAPGWYDPTGSNQVLDDDLESYIGDSWSTFTARCASVITEPRSAERIRPFDDRWPRKIYKDQRAGDIADRLSAIDWNMIMAVKDMPSITKSIATIARFMMQIKRPSTYRNVIRVFSQQYLNFNFGVMPTIYDVREALDSLIQLFEIEPVKAPIKTSLDLHGPRTCVTRPLPRTAEKVWNDNREQYVDIEKPQDCSYSVRLAFDMIEGKMIETRLTLALLPRQMQRYKGYYPLEKFKAKLDAEGKAGFLAAKAGITAEEAIPAIAQTLWDLLPWSFVIDYFFDVSSYVVNHGAAERNEHIALAELSDFRFTGYELCGTLTYHASEPDDDLRMPRLIDSVEGPTFVLSRIGLREFRRFRGLVDLPSAELKLSTPGVKQWFNIAALLGAKTYLNKR